MLYYLMEELPYVPKNLHEDWFDTEALMIQSAVSAAERLLNKFKNNAKMSKIDYELWVRMHRLHTLSQLKNQTWLEEGSIDYNLNLTAARHYSYNWWWNGSLVNRPIRFPSLVYYPEVRTNGLFWGGLATEEVKERRIKDLSDEQYEMGRDFLFPELEPQMFENQRLMRTDLRR